MKHCFWLKTPTRHCQRFSFFALLSSNQYEEGQEQNEIEEEKDDLNRGINKHCSVDRAPRGLDWCYMLNWPVWLVFSSYVSRFAFHFDCWHLMTTTTTAMVMMMVAGLSYFFSVNSTVAFEYALLFEASRFAWELTLTTHDNACAIFCHCTTRVMESDVAYINSAEARFFKGALKFAGKGLNQIKFINEESKLLWEGGRVYHSLSLEPRLYRRWDAKTDTDMKSCISIPEWDIQKKSTWNRFLCSIIMNNSTFRRTCKYVARLKIAISQKRNIHITWTDDMCTVHRAHAHEWPLNWIYNSNNNKLAHNMQCNK